MSETHGAPPLPARNLYDLFVQKARSKADKLAFWHKQEDRWSGVSLREAHRRVLKVAARLGEVGVKPGDRVAIFSENCLNWVIADLAIMARGGVVVPIYPSTTVEETEFLLRDSEAKVVFAASAKRVSAVSSLGADVVRHVMAFDQPSAGGVEGMADLVSGPDPREGVDAEGLERGAHEVATIVYTSGTTGRPKGVMLTHGNILANIAACLPIFRFSEDDVCLSFLPLSHMFERTAGYYFMLFQGVPIYYAESIEKLSRNLLEVKPTVIMSVPRLCEKAYSLVKGYAEGTGLRRIVARFAFKVAEERGRCHERGVEESGALKLRYAIADRLMFQAIKRGFGGRIKWFCSGGAPLGAEVSRFFYGIGMPIHEGYGMTETAPVISVTRPGEFGLGTVGRPVPGMEVKIAEDGEILCRGPQVMKGYLNLEEETSESLAGGWFHTGDIGEFDRNGLLRITDRKKALIVLSTGKKVAPTEIETSLKAEEMISQIVPWGENKPFISALVVPEFARLARALGLPPPRSVEDRKALVSDRRASRIIQERIDALTAKMASFKRIRRIHLHHSEFSHLTGELTPTLKVKLRVIRERFGKILDALYPK